MTDNINILKMASAMARHAEERHRLLAENIANADTANYRAKDLEPFEEAYSRFSDRNGVTQDVLDTPDGKPIWRVETAAAPGALSPNGNSVSIEDQMMRSVEAQEEHQAALMIYKKAIDIMRISLGRGA